MSRELLDRSSKRIEALLDRFSAYPAASGARADAEELVRTVSTLYGDCLREVVETLRAELGARSDALLERCCDDALTASLFITHGLHPVPLETRVRRALDSLGKTLREQGAAVEVVSVDEDTVSVRIDGPSQVVPAVEQAIFAAAPEVLDVRCAGQTISLLSAI